MEHQVLLQGLHPTLVADPAPVRTPNRALSVLLLLFVTLGTGILIVLGAWKMLDGWRLTGFTWFSLGLIWFLFFSWILRIVQKPRLA